MKRIYHIAVVICLVGLSGCGHIIRWAESNFDQGETLEPVSKVPRDYMRSVQVHRQFSTVALIDALWLSDEVRTIYAETYGLKNGKNDLMTKAFLRRQLEENKHFISFYVMTNFSLNIGDQHNTWALFLTVDDTTIAPNEIRITELTPEFKAFFGKRYNRFKSVYLVKFNAKTPDGKQLITETSQTMDLHFRSIEKEAVLTWPVNTEPSLRSSGLGAQERTVLDSASYGGLTQDSAEQVTIPEEKISEEPVVSKIPEIPVAQTTDSSAEVSVPSTVATEEQAMMSTPVEELPQAPVAAQEFLVPTAQGESEEVIPGVTEVSDNQIFMPALDETPAAAEKIDPSLRQSGSSDSAGFGGQEGVPA